MILEENIDDNLWPEIILAIIQNKNIKLINVLERGNPHQALLNSSPNVNHLRVFGSIVYIFIYEQKQNLKLEKFETQALKSTLIKYDGHIIYRVFIREQDKVIWVKNLQIFEDISKKASTILFDFKEKSTFKDFFVTDQKSNSLKSDDDTITNNPAKQTKLSKS